MYSESDGRWVYSGWQPATNVILQGSILGFKTLNIFINHWHVETENIPTKLAGDIELRDEVGISVGRDILLGEPGF